jgi:hypothetical protein
MYELAGWHLCSRVKLTCTSCLKSSQCMHVHSTNHKLLTNHTVNQWSICFPRTKLATDRDVASTRISSQISIGAYSQ